MESIAGWRGQRAMFTLKGRFTFREAAADVRRMIRHSLAGRPRGMLDESERGRRGVGGS
jgi:hypothetical protein